jgi:hypothetical protein
VEQGECLFILSQEKIKEIFFCSVFAGQSLLSLWTYFMTRIKWVIPFLTFLINVKNPIFIKEYIL